MCEGYADFDGGSLVLRLHVVFVCVVWDNKHCGWLCDVMWLVVMA